MAVIPTITKMFHLKVLIKAVIPAIQSPFSGSHDKYR